MPPFLYSLRTTFFSCTAASHLVVPAVLHLCSSVHTTHGTCLTFSVSSRFLHSPGQHCATGVSAFTLVDGTTTWTVAHHTHTPATAPPHAAARTYHTACTTAHRTCCRTCYLPCLLHCHTPAAPHTFLPHTAYTPHHTFHCLSACLSHRTRFLHFAFAFAHTGTCTQHTYGFTHLGRQMWVWSVERRWGGGGFWTHHRTIRLTGGRHFLRRPSCQLSTATTCFSNARAHILQFRLEPQTAGGRTDGRSMAWRAVGGGGGCLVPPPLL